MAAFWLGAVVGGCAVAVAAVWAGFFLYRRHLESLEAAKIHLEAVRRAHYESDVLHRRRAADWDSFAGQVLSSADGSRFSHLLTLIPAHSGLRRFEDQEPNQADVRTPDGTAPSAT